MARRRCRHRQPKPTYLSWTKNDSRSFKKAYGLNKRERRKLWSLFSW